MTYYLDRVLRAFWVPQNLELPTKIVEGQLRNILKQADIHCMGWVRGPHANSHGYTMVIDEDGGMRQQKFNQRAQFYSQYPLGYPIVGDALFFSEDWIDDGIETVDLSDQALIYLQAPSTYEAYEAWLKQPDVQHHIRRFTH